MKILPVWPAFTRSITTAESTAAILAGWTPAPLFANTKNAANELEDGELSLPVRSQFGWHLIEVTGRRTVDETEQNKRNKIYSQLLQQKQNEVFELWKRRLRDEAYVVFPGQPDA